MGIAQEEQRGRAENIVRELRAGVNRGAARFGHEPITVVYEHGADRQEDGHKGMPGPRIPGHYSHEGSPKRKKTMLRQAEQKRRLEKA